MLEAHRRQLGQELIREPGVDEEPQPGRRMVDGDQLVELVTDPFRRHDLEPRRHRRHRADELLGRCEFVAGDEAGRPQHPQRVVTEADLRRGGCPQGPRREVGRTAERIDERRHPGVDGELEGHRVDGEVAP